MTDGYLKEQMKKYDDHLPNVYDNTSGYIHFSEKSVYQSIYEYRDKSLKFQIGGALNEKHNAHLIECAEAYIHYCKLFLAIMNCESEWKKSFDKSYKEKQNGKN
jgi:hypothetical protein